MTTIRITVIIPGYSKSVHSSESLRSSDFRPYQPKLTWQCTSETLPWQVLLARSLGLVSNDTSEIPFAAWFHETKHFYQQSICVDPIHIAAGINSVRVISAQGLSISDGEAVAILQSLNEFFKDDNLHFFRFNSQLWGVSGLNFLGADAFPASFVSQQNVPDFVARSNATAESKRVFSEAQMLLHTHPINVARAQKGIPAINSLWFWGSTKSNRLAPDVTIQSDTKTVLADDFFARKIAQQANLTVLALDTEIYTLENNTVIVDLRLLDALLSEDSQKIELAKKAVKHQWLDPFLEGDLNKTYSLQLLTESGEQGRYDSSTWSMRQKLSKLAGRFFDQVKYRPKN